MKHLISKCVVIITFSLIVYLSSFLIPFPSEQSHYLAANIDKQVLLDAHDNGTVILVGGSHGTFSYDAATLQASLDRPVINSTLHAGLGLRFILDSVLPYVQEDDMILLILEHGHYLQSPNSINSDILRRMVTINYNNTAPYINHPQQLFAIFNYHSEYTLNMISRTYINDSSRDCLNSVYCRSSFTPLGNINSSYQVVTEQSQQSIQTAVERPHSYEQYNQLNISAINLLNQFNEQIQQRGAEVYIIMPALPATIMNNSPDDLQQFLTLIENNVDIEVINQPYGIPDFLYYDTIYHLNHMGKAMNTLYMTAFIQNAINP
ncbi:MAG: hypothetical protein WBC91_25395 [Phototrophicaceae bacterium]